MANVLAKRCLASAASNAFSATRQTRLQHVPVRMQSFAPMTRSFGASSRVLEKRYTEDHEWIELSDDKTTGTIGISTFAAKALGDVVFVELPTEGLEVAQGETMGAVESVKSASDIMSPISGTVTEINTALEEKPSTINSSPEENGWLAKIKLSNASEIDNLMDAEAYNAFTEKAE